MITKTTPIPNANRIKGDNQWVARLRYPGEDGMMRNQRWNQSLGTWLRSLAGMTVVVLLATACTSTSNADSQVPAATQSPSASQTTSPDSQGSATSTGIPSSAADPGGKAPATAQATLHTNKGNIKIELFGAEAPQTVSNFIGLATGKKEWTDPETGETTTDPLYDGLTFHRVIPGFMIQGGDPLGTGSGGPGYQFDDEFSPDKTFDKPYLLAMANSGPDTNGSQFFITVAEPDWLNFKHTIFGEVADKASMKVVDKIAAVPTGAQDKPNQDVVIKSITIKEG
jgi:peptidyl-prolyl cis-trans isomerase A (cyclophilin A)